MARFGRGFTFQNPLVGCVIVQENKIISESYHKRFGGPHAEVNAINNVSSENRSLLTKATMFVSLEPCNHKGKTPPCTEFVLENEIPSIVVNCKDPNQNVKGGGLEKLAAAGLSVKIIGGYAEDQEKLMKSYRVNLLGKRPYIILKWAKSADGFIGKPGNRVKISEPLTDRLVHKWRGEADAIMVGTNTAIIDNPRLTNRFYSGKSPIRIVLDRGLKIPCNNHLYDGRQKTWVFTLSSPANDININKGVEFFELEPETNNLEFIIKTIFIRGISTLFVEGGATLILSFLNAGLWDECRVIGAPLLLETGIPSPAMSSDPDVRFKLRNDWIMVWKNKP